MIEVGEDRIIEAEIAGADVDGVAQMHRVQVKVIALHYNKREGVGLLLEPPNDRNLIQAYRAGKFVQFGQFKEDRPPRIVVAVFEIDRLQDWEIL